MDLLSPDEKIFYFFLKGGNFRDDTSQKVIIKSNESNQKPKI